MGTLIASKRERARSDFFQAGAGLVRLVVESSDVTDS
jgi:hypothetical protein